MCLKSLNYLVLWHFGSIVNYLGLKPFKYLENSVFISTFSDRFNPLVSITAAPEEIPVQNRSLYLKSLGIMVNKLLQITITFVSLGLRIKTNFS